MYPSRPLPVMPNAPRARPAMVPRARGFSLIELMVAVAILAILLALAVPSFQDMIQRNRVRTAAADLATGLNLARGEAIKRGTSVRLCVDSTNKWSAAVSSDGDLIREGHVDESVSISPDGTYDVSGTDCVRFRPDGLAYGHATNPTLMTAGSFTISAGSHERVVNIKVGSIHVTED